MAKQAHFEEHPAVVTAIADEAGVDQRYARAVLRDLHHVIDRLVGADVSILLSPLYLTMRGDPVLERIIERFTPEDWAHLNGYKTASPRELAAYLELQVEEIYWRPPAFGTTVLGELATWPPYVGERRREVESA